MFLCMRVCISPPLCGRGSEVNFWLCSLGASQFLFCLFFDTTSFLGLELTRLAEPETLESHLPHTSPALGLQVQLINPGLKKIIYAFFISVDVQTPVELKRWCWVP